MTRSSDNPQAAGHDWLDKAEVLTEALPFMRRYSGHRLVIKFGGNAMGEAETLRSFAKDMVLLHQVGTCPLVVHGGGPQIGEMLKKLDIPSEFVNGLRVTDADTVSVVEMVLAGAINKGLVAAIHQAGGRAVGISGKDGQLITARKIGTARGDSKIEDSIDLGFVGEPESVDTTVIDALIKAMIIPVIAPVASDQSHATYNINADTAAGAIASAMEASRLIMLTDVKGVLDKDGQLIPQLTISEAEKLIADGTINGGMIPKVTTCIEAVRGGANGAVILDGRQKHATLIELFTEDGTGTIFIRD
ncbi:MAG: acetylglutamate kinase [Candidatus Puniceispirillales bacterium]